MPRAVIRSNVVSPPLTHRLPRAEPVLQRFEGLHLHPSPIIIRPMEARSEMRGGQMLWGQDVLSPEPQRFRKEGLLWLDPPPGGDRSWPKGKMQYSACVRQRVAEAETSDHAHLRKQETVSQWGREDRSVGKAARAFRSPRRRPWRNEAVTERTWLPAEGRIPGPALDSGKRPASWRDIGQGEGVSCAVPSPPLRSPPPRARSRSDSSGDSKRRQHSNSNSAQWLPQLIWSDEVHALGFCPDVCSAAELTRTHL